MQSISQLQPCRAGSPHLSHRFLAGHYFSCHSSQRLSADLCVSTFWKVSRTQDVAIPELPVGPGLGSLLDTADLRVGRRSFVLWPKSWTQLGSPHSSPTAFPPPPATGLDRLPCGECGGGLVQGGNGSSSLAKLVSILSGTLPGSFYHVHILERRTLRLRKGKSLS